MSEPRDHLEAARREYRAARYPGDLAAEIFAARSASGARSWVWTVGAVAATTAAAAALALFVLLHEAPSDGGLVSDDNPARALEVSLGAIPAINMPQLPPDMHLLPEALDISFATPSFSFVITEEPFNQTPTTEESV
jgi:hypothetical protein